MKNWNEVELIDAEWVGYRAADENTDRAKSYVHTSDFDALLAAYKELQAREHRNLLALNMACEKAPWDSVYYLGKAATKLLQP